MNKKQKLCEIARGLLEDYRREYFSNADEPDDYTLLKIYSHLNHNEWKTMKALRLLGCTFKTKPRPALTYHHEGNLIDTFLNSMGIETERLEFERDKMKDKRRSEERHRRY